MESSNRPETHESFEWRSSQTIESLHVEVQQFEHKQTGAQHIHLASDDDQNSFLIAFRTVPEDSTGVAHILEHTSLCGSRRYPVRDPFFMMTRRSLNTFMNAFTSSDWTAYPFASRNLKDFDNLLQVYMDAVFYPNLNPLDFAQEGHRVEFESADDPSSALTYKGVVYNEMKGAMSSPVSALWQALSRELFPTITYHHNSGGDPEKIPDLSYEQLKAFHQNHYHPSNAVIMTYGNIPAHELQARFDELALNQFKRQDLNIEINDEQRLPQPITIEDRYAFDGGDSTNNRTHIVLGWLMDKSFDAEAVMRAHLLSGVLLENSASPLRQVLETSKLGQSPSPLCGVTDSMREMVFSCGLEGSNEENADAVEALILSTLEQIASDGVPQQMVEAVLHQLELSQREISGDGFPYGLQLLVHALGGTLYGANSADILDIDPILERLHQQIKDPDFIKSEVRKLLDNPHRVRLIMKPDTTLSAERTKREKERLESVKASLTPEQIAKIIQQTHELEARQVEQDDPELLPKVGIEDIPDELTIPVGEQGQLAEISSTWFSRSTNGLVYQQLIVDLPALNQRQLQLLPLLTEVITEVGSHGRSYLETQILQSAVTGGIGSSATVRSAVDDFNRYRGFFTLSGKALARNQASLTELMYQTLNSPRFDELTRIRELIAQERMGQEQRVTGSGHMLAMSAASSGLTPTSLLHHRWGGLEGIRWIKQLDDSLDDTTIATLCEELQAIAQLLGQSQMQLLLIGEDQIREQSEQSFIQQWQGHSTATALKSLQLPTPEGSVHQAWSTSTQVNFCAKSYHTITATHEDAPALMVLSGFLRNNFLHRAIREKGGAYGGGASFDADNGAFRFYSYRDPRLDGTLNDFDASIDWLLSNHHPWQQIEEAILGVISSIDKPGSPAGEAKSAFHAALHGRTIEHRQRFRKRVLEVTEADLKRVAERYLQKDRAHTAVISSPSMLEQSQLNLEIINL